MSYILNIETATTVCSVSISQNEELLFLKELDEGFTHAENLHLFIRQALKDTGISAKELSAVAVGKGPGSYTGLRIGVSTAKGLAYAMGIPLIGIDTLQIMAAAAFSTIKEAAFYCPMIDARRMEVYTAIYDKDLQPSTEIEALIVDEASVKKFSAYPGIYFFGDGMPKCRELLQNQPNSLFIEQVKPSAKEMAGLAYARYSKQAFENTAYFEPFYLKDFMAGKKKSIL